MMLIQRHLFLYECAMQMKAEDAGTAEELVWICSAYVIIDCVAVYHGFFFTQ